jgi:hypothetical protein
MKKIIYFLGILIALACSSSEKITVKNVQDLTSYGNNTFIYSLPRTKINIHITAIRKYTVPGPYCQYSEKLIGLSGVSLPIEKWEIEKIDIATTDEPDPDYYYAVEAPLSENILNHVVGLSDAGLIVKVDDSNPFVQYIPDYSGYSGQDHFTDLSIKRNYIDPNDPEKVKAKKNSQISDIPTGKQKAGIKTIDQKAEEAANFIFKIRKRRFKLLAGQYDSFPDGVALETSIRELNKLENEYLSLFIGKTYTDTLKKVFFYIPQPDQEIDRNIICYFSDETGFEESQAGDGKSLVLELKDMQYTAPLDRLGMPSSTNNGKNCLLYRIPDKASMHIYFGSLTTVEGEIKVYQYGTLAPYCITSE